MESRTSSERTAGGHVGDACLGVVMPCYNEAGTVEEILRRVLAQPVVAEVIVVDDGSTDGSWQRLQSWPARDGRVRLARHEVNRGKGAAVRTGLALATAPVVVVQDADLEYDPADYPKLLAPILAGQAPVVYGSRFARGAPGRSAWWHRACNGLLTTVANWLTGLRLTDEATCYKMFRREVVLGLGLEEEGFGFCPEVTAKLARAGVPLWRLPFEAVARLCGAGGFPDRLALAAALGLAAWAVLRALLGAPLLAAGGTAGAVLWPTGAAMLLLLFPPFVNLLHSRFDVYEEAVAYEYLVGLGLIAGLVALAQRPTPRRYWALCVLAGLGGLVRPTLVFHGAAAVVAGAVAVGLGRRQAGELPAKHAKDAKGGEGGPTRSAARQNHASDHPRAKLGLRCTVAVGLGLFVAGGGVLFITNLARFGSGFEFGHKLNVQHLYGSLYATRFDHPFQQEPLGSAARELFGLLFLPKDFKAGNFYASGKFHGQSATVRWREIGLTTYDLSYLVVILAGWAAGGVAGWRLGRGFRTRSAAAWTHGSRSPLIVAALALYSLLASGPLLGFYLRNSVIASRYLLDLMPAFAAAMAAAWLAWGGLWLGHRGGRWWLGATGVLFVVWLVWQMTTSQSAYGPPRALTWAEVLERRKPARPAEVQFPADGCYTNAAAPAQTGVPFNGAGWLTPTGRLMPCAILFVQDPAFLELDLRAEAGGPIPADPEHLRAKVGLEYLQRERAERTAEGWRVRFRGPQRRRYQRGVQPVFLATVPNRHLADYEQAPWQLRQVRWRE